MKNILLLVFCSLIILPANAQVRKLEVEPNHSTVGFRISISGFSVVTGKFGNFEIDLDWDDSDFSASSIVAEIAVSSINTGIPDRDAHLRTADFFDADQYPSISFKSDSIRQINFSHFEAYGPLTMHGVSLPIVLPFQIVKMDGNTIGFSSRTDLNRLDYGVGAGFEHSSMPDFLANTIQVEIDFWTRRRKE